MCYITHVSNRKIETEGIVNGISDETAQKHMLDFVNYIITQYARSITQITLDIIFLN